MVFKEQLTSGELHLNPNQNLSNHHKRHVHDYLKYHSMNFSRMQHPKDVDIHNDNTEYYFEEDDNGIIAIKPENQINIDGGDDLFAALRIPLIVGACLGLVPINKLSEKKYGLQHFKWFHFRTALSVFITFMIFCNTIFIGNNFLQAFGNHQRSSAGSLIGIVGGVWFYAAGMLVYVFFLFRSKSLCLYFKRWVQTSEIISETMVPDKKIIRDMNLICAVVLLDCFGENILFHFHAMDKDKLNRIGELTLREVLEDYYNSNQYMFYFFDYNPVIATAVLITNKWTLYAWNFGDVILMLMARALYSRYAGLNAYLEAQMVPDGSIRMIRKGAVSWPKIRRNFLLITKLLDDANEIFSPLIWLSYTTDIFFVCNQLYMGLAPTRDELRLINKIYVAWSLVHLTMRTLAVNMIAAKINDHAHRISSILQHCYPEEYDNNVRRLERFLGSRIIGITGNGCFIITRSFILMIISCIVTLEAVLLQNSSLKFG